MLRKLFITVVFLAAGLLPQSLPALSQSAGQYGKQAGTCFCLQDGSSKKCNLGDLDCHLSPTPLIINQFGCDNRLDPLTDTRYALCVWKPEQKYCCCKQVGGGGSVTENQCTPAVNYPDYQVCNQTVVNDAGSDVIHFYEFGKCTCDLSDRNLSGNIQVTYFNEFDCNLLANGKHGVFSNCKWEPIGERKDLAYKVMPDDGKQCGSYSIQKNGAGSALPQIDSLKRVRDEAATLNPGGFSTAADVIGRVITLLFAFVGSITLVLYVYAGILWMTAAGNSEQTGKAKLIFLWTTLGIAMMMASYIIVKFVFAAFK